MTDLKPCPFCGGEAERMTLSDEENFGGDVISCKKCECCTRVVFGEKEGLVEAWNRRAYHSARSLNMVDVPREPTEDQWGGLARDIMMWLDMSDKSAPALFRHLERLGRNIPKWLLEESEMRGAGVPSKGTRATIIYRAMLEDYKPASDSGEGGK